MIELLAIADAIPRLTGDAVKLAVYLAANPTERTDAAWFKLAAAGISSSPQILRSSLKELVDQGLIAIAGRVNASSVSAPTAKIGSPKADQAEEDEEEPPWLRYRGERSEHPASRSEDGSGGRQESHLPDLSSLPAKTTTPYQVVIAAYSDAFAEANDGRKPRIDGRVGNLVKQLLETHGADEIVRRMAIMFGESRKFPPPPYDMNTLRFSFDLFATSKPRGGMVGDARKSGAGYYGEVDRG